jgi:hypothetical protein
VNNRSADVPRRIDRTHGVTPLGPDAQVDNKALVIPPGNFSLADPFPVGGPFVMNTRAEISQAFNDFHSGKFGQVPRKARLKVR